MKRLSTVSISPAKVILAATLAVVVWRAATLPLSADEALAWDRVVRPGAASVLVTPGAWSAFVYGLLAKRAAGLFRLSEFALRVPGIVGCLLYCLALYRICRRRIWLLLAFAVPAVFLNWFNLAGGSGLTIGLTAFALAHPAAAGWSLGLALAACPQIGFVPATGAAGLLYASGFWRGMERVVIPAATIGFVLLILPLSHAGPPLPGPSLPAERDAAIQAAIAVLRAEAGQGTARIASSPSAASLLDFYRDRYRQRNWLRGGQEAEYFLWVAPDSPPPPDPSRRVLFQRHGVVLAR
jgi:hypothetical protein